ncbi:hypothetical protein BO71DRAFT_480753 [Aspergillus ellipticus CBS 707.79]|uniref:Uncharacterized protein n=1 Tax=Aspergillus ellipticus CBS 707.79 TaxID=1448320 RepID=A0A319DKE8_9EURO|nr:hypothetical protein BO71DRAFT_480753 [Aspergillus ellipticus CBS 707.79]
MSSSSQNHDHLHLTEIFHLYPEEEPFCVGHASSSGHRCRQPTNAKNRHTACTLLEKGTAMLRKGQGVDKLLRDLAPLVLCNRWHQDQADHFINVWTGQNKRRQYKQQQYTSENWKCSCSISGCTPHDPQLQFQINCEFWHHGFP